MTFSRKKLTERPENFILNQNHALANGLVFAGLGNAPHSNRYHDSSSYYNNGTLTNMDPATDWVWSSELGRWVLDFAGDDDVVVLANNSLNGCTKFSISGWMYRNTSSTTGSLFESWSGVAAQMLIRVSADDPGVVQFYTYTSAQVGGSTDWSLTNTWAHFCFIYNGANMYTWKNGSVGGTAPAQTGNLYNGYLLGLGGSANGETAEYWHNGKLADCMIYNRVLSYAEIAILANRSDPMLGGLVLSPKRQFYNITYSPLATVYSHTKGLVLNRRLLLHR